MHKYFVPIKNKNKNIQPFRELVEEPAEDFLVLSPFNASIFRWSLRIKTEALTIIV
jgi:hypothetical protein